MTQTEDPIPQTLKNLLRDKRVIPFVGAGVSRAVQTATGIAMFPSWKEFLLEAARRLDGEKESGKADIVRSLVNESSRNYLDAGGYIVSGLGWDRSLEMLTEKFEVDLQIADDSSLKLARLIWELGSNLIVTTNYDLVLSDAHPGPKSVRILDNQSVELAEVQKGWNPSRPTVIHLHGSVDNKANIIFTNEQFTTFYSAEHENPKLKTLKSLFTQKTILFIGFSLDDLYILRELEEINKLYSGSGSYYALISESELSNRNIPEFVHKVPFAGFGPPLEHLVEKLCQYACARVDVITAEIDVSPTPPFYNVRYPPKQKKFIGRQGLCREISKSFKSNIDAKFGRVAIIQGLGGVGKTQLAVEYANRNRKAYKGGVFWFAANEDLDNQLIIIAQKQGWIPKWDEAVDQKKVAREKFDWLADALIIFDDVVDFEKIKSLIPSGIGIGGIPSNHILITTQESKIRNGIIRLNTLSNEESKLLFLSISELDVTKLDESEASALDKLLSEVGGLPVMIELVAAYLKERREYPLDAFLSFYKKAPFDQLLKELQYHDKKDIFRISEKLGEDNRVLDDLLFIIAWSAGAPIGKDLLQSMLDDYRFIGCLSHAETFKLIRKGQEIDRYTLHPVFIKELRSKHSLDYHNELVKKVSERILEWGDQRTGRYSSELELESDHFKAWQENIKRYSTSISISLGLVRVDILKQQGNNQEALSLLEEMGNLYISYGMPDDELLYSNLMQWKGVVYRSLGKFDESLAAKQKALEIRLRLLPEMHPSIAISFGSVGVSFGDVGNYLKSSENKEKALEIVEQIYGKGSPETSKSLNNMGIAFGCLGDNDKALEFEKRALTIRRKCLKLELEKRRGLQPGNKGLKNEVEEKIRFLESDVASSLLYVGISHGYLGDYDKALKFKQDALDIRLRIFGEEHTETAVALNNLGMTYGDLKQFEKARKYKEDALRIRLKLLGENHPDTARSYGDLGITFWDLNDYEKALKFQKISLKIRRRLKLGNHPNTATTYQQIGHTYREMGNRKKALESYRRALTIRERRLGPAHPLTIASRLDFDSYLNR